MNGWTGMCIISALTVFGFWSLGVLYFLDKILTRRGKEREMLLQRIQAPDLATNQHAVQTVAEQPRMTPRYDDDEELGRLLAGDAIGFDPMGDQ